METKKLLREIPSVDQLLKNEAFLSLQDVPRSLVVDTVRERLAVLRQQILNGDMESLDVNRVIGDCLERIQAKMAGSLRRVINATGVVLHTNLGRAVLGREACQAVTTLAAGYSNLEFDLESGSRGLRYTHTDALLRALTGAEASLVVNNNAAAVLLVLNTLARGREVVVSRGELVEIGGGFRIPEVLESSGARLVEVGTTNKTRLRDYEKAINTETAALLKVHTSNFRIVGFSESVSLEELRPLAQAYNLPLIEDLGSGCLVALNLEGMADEPTVRHSIEAGADVVTFSGDKLLGGPQAGIIVGRREYIAQMETNPLTRAFRVDKLTLTALEATLRQYLDPEKAVRTIPVLAMLTRSAGELQRMAEELLVKLAHLEGKTAVIMIRDDTSFVGGGALPGVGLPTKVVSILPLKITAAELALRLRRGEVPVVGRIQNDCLLLDLRTVLENELDELAGAVRRVLADKEETAR